MDNINWDKWQEQVDEHNPNCPWLDDEENAQEYDPYYKVDEEED